MKAVLRSWGFVFLVAAITSANGTPVAAQSTTSRTIHEQTLIRREFKGAFVTARNSSLLLAQQNGDDEPFRVPAVYEESTGKT